MNETKPPVIAEASSFLKRWSTTFKLIGVAVLILLLLVPLSMVRSVLRERLGRRNEAVADITSIWGREQKLIGPVLIVPYRYKAKSWKEQAGAGGKVEKVEVVDLVTANAYFLPTNLAVTGEVKPMELRRGIYPAVVYTGTLEFAGEFARPDFGRLRSSKAEEVLWDEALVAFAIPDLRGVKETLVLKWGEKNCPLLPGGRLGGFQSGVQSGVFATVGDVQGGEEPIPFRLALSLNGSGGLSFAPLGSQTTVKLTSPWPDPSFFGTFLPAERKVTRDGFEATWQVSYYGRNFPQQWTSQTPEPCLTPSGIESSLFGVNFLSGIDAYRNTERAIKYGVLFIVLIFAAFFLFELLAALRIHPFQYAIVGAALCLFYLGLLSLSEFIPFGFAYLASAGATTLLICFHSAKMLKSGGRTFIVAGLLAGIYGFLYIALQLQDYALLLGTGGLFAVLGAVIWFTRNIDWYARDRA
ncbi:MAG TPA: cell envelope integrity protein CreD [Candidatus Paceibacterota bacterium]|nr:cell envelope integrity protein CreD [Verrucomicrobiota bacterium]HSA11721.1 cell envelope integrity protein CreD [Candidatus Paceibacterota bacterium]